MFPENVLNPLTNAEDVAIRLIATLNLPITKSTLRKELTGHHEFPSLLAICDIFTKFGIKNLALRTDLNALKDVNFPVIIQVRSKKEKDQLFGILYDGNGEFFTFYNPYTHKKEEISISHLKEIYTGYLLLIEVGTDAGEPKFKDKQKTERVIQLMQILVVLSLPVIYFILSVHAFIEIGFKSLIPIFFGIFTFAGILLTAGLGLYEIDDQSLIRQVCGANKRVNCKSVLHSEGSKIMGISWSSIGFSYFLTVFIYLIVGGITDQIVLQHCFFLSVLALPYTVYSVYYQKFVVKSWCAICLAVQGIIVIIATLGFFGGFYQPVVSFSLSLSSLLAILIIFSGGFLFSQLSIYALKKRKETTLYKTALAKLKFNPDVFEYLLSREKLAPELDPMLGLVFGEKMAKNKLIKVCNPYCKPCSDTHGAIEDLIDSNKDVQVQIIFSTTDHERDERARPIAHFLAIKETCGEITLRAALSDWYDAEEKNYNLFANKYPLNTIGNEQDALKAMREWCVLTGITFTPTFFLNGRQLPSIYKINDLHHLLSV